MTVLFAWRFTNLPSACLSASYAARQWRLRGLPYDSISMVSRERIGNSKTAWIG